MSYRPAIIAALQAAALFAAGLIIPLIGQIAMFLMPVPLVTAGVVHGRRTGALATGIATAAAVAFGGGHLVILLLVLGLAIMALALTEALLRLMRPETAIVLGGVLPLVPLALLLLPTLAQSGGNPFSLLDEHLMKSLQEARRLYLQLGLTEVAQSLESVSDTVVHYLSRLLPGIILAMSFLQAASCYGLSRAVIVRRRPDLPMPDRSSLALWHAPDTWVWGLIAALGLIAVPNGTLRFVGLNASLIYLVIYTAQGIAIVEYFQRKARIPAFWRSLLHVLILALPTVVAVVAFGIVDIWGDFRKVRTSATGTP